MATKAFDCSHRAHTTNAYVLLKSCHDRDANSSEGSRQWNHRPTNVTLLGSRTTAPVRVGFTNPSLPRASTPEPGRQWHVVQSVSLQQSGNPQKCGPQWNPSITIRQLIAISERPAQTASTTPAPIDADQSSVSHHILGVVEDHAMRSVPSAIRQRARSILALVIERGPPLCPSRPSAVATAGRVLPVRPHEPRHRSTRKHDSSSRARHQHHDDGAASCDESPARARRRAACLRAGGTDASASPSGVAR